jgi:hypothetical protein
VRTSPVNWARRALGLFAAGARAAKGGRPTGPCGHRRVSAAFSIAPWDILHQRYHSAIRWLYLYLWPKAPSDYDIAVWDIGRGKRAKNGVRGRSSVVERQLPKLYVVGSIPIARSITLK